MVFSWPFLAVSWRFQRGLVLPLLVGWNLDTNPCNIHDMQQRFSLTLHHVLVCPMQGNPDSGIREILLVESGIRENFAFEFRFWNPDYSSRNSQSH